MVVAIQELAERDAVALGRDRSRGLPSATGDGGLEVVEHDLAALAVEVDGAARRQEREVGCDLVDDGSAPGVEDRSQPVLEAELAAVLADEVDDRQVALAGRAAQTAPELLGEDSRRCGRPEEQDAVDVGTSTPSPRTSTENTQRSSPSSQRAGGWRSRVGRVVAGERDARRPASVNLRAM